ncbi:MAG: DUF2232 domain-containing protein [Candidatus Cloacimonetes bacterium]|nr:DUF2232 domain-containing protein [Candidatus Cloacimonadota bacterium]
MGNQSARAAKTGMMVALTVVLFFAMRLPFVGVLAGFFLPVPLVLCAVQNGMGALGMGLLGTGLLLGVLVGPVSFLGWLPFGTVSLVLGAGYTRRYTLKRYLITGTMAYTLVAGLIFGLGSALTGVDVFLELRTVQEKMLVSVEEQMVKPASEQREKLFSEYQALMQETPVSLDLVDQKKKALDTARQREESSAQMIRQWRDMAQNPLPILIFAGLLYLLIVLKVLNTVANRFRLGSFPALQVKDWKCPVSLTWFFLLVILSAPWWNQPREAGQDLSTLASAMLSLFVVMELLYFCFGLSLLLFLTDRWQLPTPLRIVMMSAGILFAQIIMLLGIFDSFFDIRNTGRESTEKGI